MSVNPDTIPRYREPTEERVPERRHGNCGHSCEIQLEGHGWFVLCCCERDKIGCLGEVYVIDDPDAEGCKDWEAM